MHLGQRVVPTEVMFDMFLLSRLLSKGPHVLVTFLIFSLSAGVLGGILFYIDSTGPEVLADLTQGTDVDMEISLTPTFYNQNTTDIDDIEGLLDVDEIISIERLSVIDTYLREDWYYYYYSHAIFLGIEPSFLGSFPDAVSVASDTPTLSDDTCYMEVEFFTEGGYEIGGNYTAQVITYDEYYEEVIVEATYEITGTFVSTIFMEEYYPYYYYDDHQQRETALTIITTKDSINANFEDIGFSRYDGISERYWIDIDSDMVLESDIDAVYDSLDNIRRQFEQQALPFAMVSSFALRSAVQQYQSWSLSMITLSLAFSIPTVIMGILLIYYNTNLMSDETRRDIGTIKTRGASGWQSFSWIISSALLTGFVGSFGAIAMGTISAMLSATVKVFFVFDFTQLAGLALILSPQALLSVFLFAFGVGLIVALPIAIKSFLMTATEAHSILERDVLLSRQNLGSPLWEIIALCISAYFLIPILSLLSFLSYFGVFQLFFIILLIPMMGLFVISFTRLLARPVASVKASLLSRIGKRMAKVGNKVMSRTLLSYKKSEAIGAVFIAMVFVVGVMSGISASTASEHTESIYKFYTGSDIAITVKNGLDNVTLDIMENLTMVDGVAAVSPVLKVQQYVSYWSMDWNRRYYYNESMLIYGIDPTLWLESAFWLSYFTFGADPHVSVPKLLDNETNVISSFRPIDHYVGEGYSQRPVYSDDISLSLRTEAWSNVTNMKIVDVLGSGNEVYSTKYLQGEPQTSWFVVVNLDFLHQYLNTSSVNKFLIKLNPNVNYTSIMRELYEIAPHSFESIECALSGIDEVQESRAGQAIYGVYTLNVLFTVIYLSIGMMIVATVRIQSLRKQFSVLRALGTDSKEISRSVLLETALSVLISLGIGALLGLILAAYSINMPLIYFGTTTLQMWQRLPVLLSIPWVTLGVIIFVSFAFALLAAYLVTKSTLKRNIAEEMQYTE